MEKQNYYNVKIIADETFIGLLKEYANQSPDDIKIESEIDESKDATDLGFELVSVLAVLAVVKELFYVGELAVKIYQWLKKSKDQKIIIVTPFRTIELHSNTELTVEDIRKLLQAAQDF